MKKIFFLFWFVLILNNSLFADFVSLGSFQDQDGISVNLFKLTEEEIKSFSSYLLDAFMKYYEKYEKKECPLDVYQRVEGLFDDPKDGIVITAYKNNVCVGWIMFMLYKQDKVLYLEDIRVWLLPLYSTYLIFSVFQLSEFQNFKIYLTCNKNNSGIQKLFNMLGFNLSSEYKFNRYQIMEYDLNLYIQNIEFEINDVWVKLLYIESCLNLPVPYIYYREIINNDLRDNISNIEKIVTKMELYYKSRLYIFPKFFDFNTRSFYQSLINSIDVMKIKLNMLESRLDESV